MLGICLGAQLMAAALGAPVYESPHKEIGWFAIDKYARNRLTENLEKSITVFHWHGDTFDLPEKCTRLFSSMATPNQAFLYNNNGLAMQFHLEMTPALLKGMVENCADDLTPGMFCQTSEEILKQTSFFDANKKALFVLLDNFANI
ncbi:MAG: hypothetical protein HC896_11730 [Bacteroidales bacterium]|nr:hypothetical protein [Bacteroidales bacterium]